MFTTNMKDLRKLPEFALITSVILKKDQFENKHSFIHSGVVILLHHCCFIWSLLQLLCMGGLYYIADT